MLREHVRWIEAGRGWQKLTCDQAVVPQEGLLNFLQSRAHVEDENGVQKFTRS